MKLSKRTWNEVTVPWEILLEACVTVDSANDNCRWKFLSMAGFWGVIKCETEKEYYEKPRHYEYSSSLSTISDLEKNKSWQSLLFISWAKLDTCSLFLTCRVPCSIIAVWDMNEYNIPSYPPRIFMSFMQKPVNCKLAAVNEGVFPTI